MEQDSGRVVRQLVCRHIVASIGIGMGIGTRYQVTVLIVLVHSYTHKKIGTALAQPAFNRRKHGRACVVI